MQAQDLIDDTDYEKEETMTKTDEEIVMQELQLAIHQELTVPMEDRDIYWAQTLIDSV